VQMNIDVWNERANNFYEQKRYKEAYLHYSGKVLEGRELTPEEEELKRKLKRDPDAREWTIVSLRKMRCFDEARHEVNAALSSLDRKLDILSELGALHYAERDYDNAIRVFDRTLEIDDHDTFALQWRAAALRKKAKLAGAKLTEAEQAVDEALKKVPYSTQLWDECGWLAFEKGEYEAAIKAFEKAYELDPYLINKQFAKVETLLILKRSDDALEVFKKLEQQFPNDAELVEQLCWFYIRTGQYELAHEQARRLRHRHPHSALAFNAEGGAELALRNYEQAVTAFSNAIKEVDYEPAYYVNLALALIRQVKTRGELAPEDKPKQEQLIDQAKTNCRKALKLDPYCAKAYGCLGVIAYKQEAFLDAESYFKKSIEVSPTEGSYVELGSLYCQMGCYEKASATLQKALEINANDALAYIELGNVAVMKGDNNEAIRYCREALHVGPKNPDTHRALAIALMRGEQYAEAESVVRTALRSLEHIKPWRLYLLLAEILVRIADLANKGRKKKDLDLYQEALGYVNQARRIRTQQHADVLFHSGIVHYKLDDFATSQRSFSECLKLNKERFDAERNSSIVQAAIAQQKSLFTVNKLFSYGLAVICVVMLAALWISYFMGWKRTIIIDPPTAASGSTVGAPVAQEQFIVDQPLLNLMTPILLGLLTIAALLPNLSKLKLPGFEAEIVEPKPTEPNISMGPRGDVVFGTSLPIIDPEPR
jgi:tetratricopeptide (TPR) repeat protein